MAKGRRRLDLCEITICTPCALAWHQSELEQIAQRIAQGQYLGARAPTRVPYGLALSPAPWP